MSKETILTVDKDVGLNSSIGDLDAFHEGRWSWAEVRPQDMCCYTSLPVVVIVDSSEQDEFGVLGSGGSSKGGSGVTRRGAGAKERLRGHSGT